ncbi:MAG: ribose 5-phosphate isomerase B [Cyclobacteriaceae bacterium]|nr:ribose 5-phosphate isomerase B [Cyclobacteriaceae bacterium]
MKYKIAIGSDHAGYELKGYLVSYLQEQGHTVTDFGPASSDSVDYPDFAHPVASEVEGGGSSLGILICGSANGVAMTANKHQGIRAGIAWIPEIASLAKQHNNANIICIPARYVENNQAKEIVNAFLSAEFEGGRHANRVNKIGCS